jgi:hypothetical protein
MNGEVVQPDLDLFVAVVINLISVLPHSSNTLDLQIIVLARRAFLILVGDFVHSKNVFPRYLLVDPFLAAFGSSSASKATTASYFLPQGCNSVIAIIIYRRAKGESDNCCEFCEGGESLKLSA